MTRDRSNVTALLDDAPSYSRQNQGGIFVVIKGPDRGDMFGSPPRRSRSARARGATRVLGPDGVAPAPGGALAGDGVVLRDFGSTNGSFTHGSRFKEIAIGLRRRGQAGQDRAQVPAPRGDRRAAGEPTKRTSASSSGCDAKMRRLFGLLRDIAPSDTTVLIEGETGTGKELIAEEIHRHSRRARTARSWSSTAARCPRELIESTLFGHVKGRFTGAIADRKGRLRRGPRRHDLPRRDRRAGARSAAGAAARARQAGGAPGRLERLRAGRRARGRRDQPRPARGGRPQGVPRGSLLPPGRHPRAACRRCASAAATSPLLTEHFMRQFSRRARPAASRPRSMARLRSHSWPGNVRELRNVIERACVLSNGADAEHRRRAGRARCRRRCRWASGWTCRSRRPRASSSSSSSASTSWI